jgi:hypothetical protein
LSGSIFVHRASTFHVKKDAVRVLLFDETDNPSPHDPRVLSTELSVGETKTMRKYGDLLIADTHGAGKTGTATPTPLTFESKSVFIPKLIPHKITFPVLENHFIALKKNPALMPR